MSKQPIAYRLNIAHLLWGCSWTETAKEVLNERYGESWYCKPTTIRLRDLVAARVRDRWFGRVITMSTIVFSIAGAVVLSVAFTIIKAWLQ